jgi:hypothetical protein
MRGVHPLVAAVLVIAISISAIALVLAIGAPAIQRGREALLLAEAKSNMAALDAAVREVIYGGEGSARVLSLDVSAGVWQIKADTDVVTFEMVSVTGLLEPGLAKVEDNLNITATERAIVLTLSWAAADIISDLRLAAGRHRLIIRNVGWRAPRSLIEISRI